MPRTKRHDPHEARNGAGGGDDAAHPDDAAEAAASDRMKRAEEAVDRVALAVGMYTSMAGRKLLRWAAQVREGAEDMWAEARQIRDRNRAAEPPTDTAEPETPAEPEHPHRRGHRH